MNNKFLDLTVNGRDLRLEVYDGFQPTVFSLFLANMLRPDKTIRLAVDAGAGGGILSIVLALSGVAKVFAIERSREACDLIVSNARANGVLSRIEVVCSDIRDCSAIRDVDLVVSNPPTVPERQQSPVFVSGSGRDGLVFLRMLLEASGHWLRHGGSAQMVISSLVDQRKFAEACSEAGLSVKAVSMMLAPVREFYRESYTPHELKKFLAKGNLLSENLDGTGHLNEVVTFYECIRA